MATFTDFVAGRFTGTWNSVDLGITRNGYEIMVSPAYESIADSDLGGESILDLVYQGGNCTVRAECKEYKAGTYTPFWPWGGSILGRVFSSSYPVGRLASDLAAAHVLTSVANTPAASKPASLTGSFAILAPGQNGQLMFNTKLRHVPIFMQYLPFVSGSNDYRHFTTT